MSSSTPGSGKPRRGKLIVISGPSGAGKTSICRAILEQWPKTVWSISVTTRPMRDGEVSGESYTFVSADEFARRESAGDFLECATYVGCRYGTPRAPVEAALERGLNVMMEIDVQGGVQVAGKMPESIRVFVLPPDQASLRTRLEGRHTEAKEQLSKRLAKADGEIALARDSGCYPHFVVNDDLEATVQEVKRIVQQESGVT